MLKKRLEVVDTFRMEFLRGGAALECGELSPPYDERWTCVAAVSALNHIPETSSECCGTRSKAAITRRAQRTLRVGKAKPRQRSLTR